jgi:multiple sugar transport system permease protein
MGNQAHVEGPVGPSTLSVARMRDLVRRHISLGVGLVAPVIIYLVLVQAYPLFSALATSLTDKRIGTDGTFIGFQNYADLIDDPIFRQTVRNSLLFTFGAIAFKLTLGMIMALVLNQQMVLRNLWRALLFIPWTIPTIITVLTFRWMYSPIGGVFNHLLLRNGLIDYPIDWLGRPNNALASVIVVNIWRGTPFFGISLLGGLQAIPNEMYEAAQIDGANRFQQFLYITIPSLRNVAILVTLVSTIWTLNDFQIIWVLTRGGPANSTQVFATLTYTEAFLNLELGRAIAISAFSIPLLAVLIGWATNTILRRD